MSIKLGNDDRHAIDLLLDRVHPGTQAPEGVVLTPGDAVPQRVHSVEKILSKLHAMPAGDPPADLTSKTLRRVDSAIATLSPAAQAAQHDGAENRPVA